MYHSVNSITIYLCILFKPIMLYLSIYHKIIFFSKFKVARNLINFIWIYLSQICIFSFCNGQPRLWKYQIMHKITCNNVILFIVCLCWNIYLSTHINIVNTNILIFKDFQFLKLIRDWSFFCRKNGNIPMTKKQNLSTNLNLFCYYFMSEI